MEMREGCKLHAPSLARTLHKITHDFGPVSPRQPDKVENMPHGFLRKEPEGMRKARARVRLVQGLPWVEMA